MLGLVSTETLGYRLALYISPGSNITIREVVLTTRQLLVSKQIYDHSSSWT